MRMREEFNALALLTYHSALHFIFHLKMEYLLGNTVKRETPLQCWGTGLNLICEITILAMRSSKTHFGWREDLQMNAREIHHSFNSLCCRSLSEIASSRVRERERQVTKAHFKTAAWIDGDLSSCSPWDWTTRLMMNGTAVAVMTSPTLDREWRMKSVRTLRGKKKCYRVCWRHKGF